MCRFRKFAEIANHTSRRYETAVLHPFYFLIVFALCSKTINVPNFIITIYAYVCPSHTRSTHICTYRKKKKKNTRLNVNTISVTRQLTTVFFFFHYVCVLYTRLTSALKNVQLDCAVRILCVRRVRNL